MANEIYTTPLEVYFAFKTSPTDYWAAKIRCNPYVGNDDSDPFELEPNVCGPIVDPDNVSFVEKIEPPVEAENKLQLLSSYNAIMVVDRYHQVPYYHKVSVDFNQRVYLGEILRETLDLEGNEDLKGALNVRNAPALFIRTSTSPLTFSPIRRELTYPVIYELIREEVGKSGSTIVSEGTSSNNNNEHGEICADTGNSTDPTGPVVVVQLEPPDSYKFPDGNRYITCSGTTKFGTTLEVRHYTFDFGLKDFSGFTSETTFEADLGLSKILTGKSIPRLSALKIPGPYRLKVFFQPDKKDQVQGRIELEIDGRFRLEIDGSEELVYKIFDPPPPSQPNQNQKDTALENLINYLNDTAPVDDWGISGADTIYKFSENKPLEVIGERAITNINPDEDLIEQLLDNVFLDENEREKIRQEYEAYVETNPFTRETLEQWEANALRKKSQVLYFQRKEVVPVVTDDPDFKPVEVIGETSAGSDPEFERYDATGDIPIAIYGSWERALDEAKQNILKEHETVELPNGELAVEYKDFMIGTYRKYHLNGYLWRIETYKNETRAMKSLLDGPYFEWYEDGRRRIIGGFQDNLLHGAYRQFYRNTLPACQGTLRRGKLNGVYVQWDDEGNRLFKAYYIGGTLNNSYVLDYQVFASTPCLSRNLIFIELRKALEKLDDEGKKRTYTFNELFTLVTDPEPGDRNSLLTYPLLDVDNQPEQQLLAILDTLAQRISGGDDHGKYILRDNILIA